MNRNTSATLGELREGDRFYYNSKNKTVWEVISNTKSASYVNQPDGKGGYVFKYPEMKKASTPVIFLRHTRPLPGDECLLQDLKPGDVFHLPEDIITEYLLESHMPGANACVAQLPDTTHYFDKATTVVFVKHQEVKHV